MTYRGSGGPEEKRDDELMMYVLVVSFWFGFWEERKEGYGRRGIRLGFGGAAEPSSTMATNLSPPTSSKEKGKKKKKKEKLSGQETASVPPELLVVEMTVPLTKDGFLKALEPSIETSELWQSQVPLSFKVDNTLHAILGPIATREELDSISHSFPSTVEHLPLVFCKDVKMDYFKTRVFRTRPQQEARALFSKWKARLRPFYRQIWVDAGINQALQLACYDLSYHQSLLGANLSLLVECLHFLSKIHMYA
ncbi:hypothetical protein PIB30_073511 [Stylosanthes scabra]|uniref:Uncharacterized protein n=1 Tax=Stylosanthes scabra TaxID=79078 RepID=A0ABU6WP32_9FABA|nr:hypothetical protein [Stylosanthes scabra]